MAYIVSKNIFNDRHIYPTTAGSCQSSNGGLPQKLALWLFVLFALLFLLTFFYPSYNSLLT